MEHASQTIDISGLKSIVENMQDNELLVIEFAEKEEQKEDE